MSAVSNFSGARPADLTGDVERGRSGYKKLNRDIDIGFVVGAIFFALGCVFTLASCLFAATGFGMVVTVPLALAGLACAIVPLSIGILGFCNQR